MQMSSNSEWTLDSGANYKKKKMNMKHFCINCILFHVTNYDIKDLHNTSQRFGVSMYEFD